MEPIPEKVRCQSCGMPLTEPSGFGTNADGTQAGEYCRFCFQHGQFTQPELTVEGMIQSSIDFMTAKLGFPRTQAEEMSRNLIPTLKRWQ
ncbi:zinc ribbon domain-containing protein [candidate division KSB1 bacterium]|nr:zinc ribbon domain-containing protein [candidate division KSB1 bacterium]